MRIKIDDRELDFKKAHEIAGERAKKYCSDPMLLV
ncbi:MAG: hypothetical protein GY749_07165 [Desulfobacteraceae bacterium]|nr:hypothetical protein [Desulfobacteraceae bacterium]